MKVDLLTYISSYRRDDPDLLQFLPEPGPGWGAGGCGHVERGWVLCGRVQGLTYQEERELA